MQTGEHYCVRFDTDAARATTAAAFVRAGLVGHDKVIYLADLERDHVLRSLAIRKVDPRPHISAGQLVVGEAQEMSSAAGSAEVGWFIDLLRDQVTEALEQGYPRLRIIQEATGLFGTRLAADQLREFEHLVTDFLVSSPALALCQYDGRRYPPEHVTMVEQSHTGSFSPDPNHDDGMLRIQRTRLPTGLRLAGEVDVTNRHALAEALEALSSSDEEIHIDVSDLEFIDADGAGLLVDTATALAPAGRQLILDAPQHPVRRTLDLYWGLPNNLIIIDQSSRNGPT